VRRTTIDDRDRKYGFNYSCKPKRAKPNLVARTVPAENSVQPTSLQTNRKVSSGLQPSLNQMNEILTMQAYASRVQTQISKARVEAARSAYQAISECNRSDGRRDI